MKKSVIGFLTVAMFALAACVLFLLPARAADPEVSWRESVRAVIGTNGIVAGVIKNADIATNAAIAGSKLNLSGLTISGAAGGSVTQTVVTATLPVTVNGTNYNLKLYLPTGP